MNSHEELPSTDFKSAASTNSAIPPWGFIFDRLAYGQVHNTVSSVYCNTPRENFSLPSEKQHRVTMNCSKTIALAIAKIIMPFTETQFVALLYVVLSGTYLLVLPGLVYFYLKQRWYVASSVERLIMYLFVFLSFPGMLLLSPFLNFRPKGRDLKA